VNALSPMAGPPGSVAFPRQAETDEQLIRLWLHGRPKNTQRAYSRDAERFRAFAGKALAQVTVGDIQAFRDSLDNLSDASRARLLSSVKSLLTYGHRIGYLPFNVGAPVYLPRVKDTIAEQILPEKTVLEMIAFETNVRNKAVVRLLYSAGLRVSELSGLDWKDFQPRAEAA
jgi:integrase/recombinase XerD